MKSRMLICMALAALVAVTTSARGDEKPAAAQAAKKSQNNLKQIALAMHNYASANRYLPPPAIVDKDGKALLSWRVLILPYIEEDKLYREFKLDEPWDSEHNKKLIDRMPKLYVLPGDKAKYDLPSTYYRVFQGSGSLFDPKRKMSLEQATALDGLSNTILVVEAADAVPWTKPQELEFDAKKLPKLGYHFAERCNIAFGDGAVRAIKMQKEETLRRMIGISDGQPYEID